MRWLIEDDVLQPFLRPISELEETSVALVVVRNYFDQLLGSEKTRACKMSPKRSQEFSSGRYAVHLAHKAIGLTPTEILSEGRVPIWPGGQVGAITHVSKYAGAIVSSELKGVGLDFERVGRIRPKLHKKLFTDFEENWLSQQTRQEASTIMFSAKESVYKSIYPILNRYVGFQEVEINLDWASSTFAVRYRTDDMSEISKSETRGFWSISEDYVLTIVEVR